MIHRPLLVTVWPLGDNAVVITPTPSSLSRQSSLICKPLSKSHPRSKPSFEHVMSRCSPGTPRTYSVQSCNVWQDIILGISCVLLMGEECVTAYASPVSMMGVEGVISHVSSISLMGEEGIITDISCISIVIEERYSANWF